MAILALQTLVGNIGRVYELRTVGKNNSSVVDFSVAVTPRKKDGDDWVDGTTYWVRCTAWNKLAENVAASFKSGDQVILHGRVEMKDPYKKADGEMSEAQPVFIVDFAGLEVGRNPAESKRPNRGSNSGGGQANRPAAKKPAPKVEEPETDIFSDDEFDFDDDDAPF